MSRNKMMNCILFIVVTASFMDASLGQVLGFGACPSVTVQEDFDISKYMGKWYENRRFFAFFEILTNCVTADYTLLADGSVEVNNTGYNYIRSKYVSTVGSAEQSEEPAKLEVGFSDNMPTGDYWVLSTDYDSYSVVWSCSEFLGFLNFQLAWILTREPEGVSVERIDDLYELMGGFGINTQKFQLTSQMDCGNA